MCNPDYIIRTAPEVLVGGLHHKQNVFQTFLDGGKVKKRFQLNHVPPLSLLQQ